MVLRFLAWVQIPPSAPEQKRPDILVIPGFSCIYNGLRCFLRVHCSAHACMITHSRAHLNTHFYERLYERKERVRSDTLPIISPLRPRIHAGGLRQQKAHIVRA